MSAPIKLSWTVDDADAGRLSSKLLNGTNGFPSEDCFAFNLLQISGTVVNGTSPAASHVDDTASERGRESSRNIPSSGYFSRHLLPYYIRNENIPCDESNPEMALAPPTSTK